MAPRLAHFVVGFLLLAAGITAVIIAEIGPGPAELLMLAIHDRGYPLAPARPAIEIFCVAPGWSLGGQIGAGTVFAAGPIALLLRWTLRTYAYASAQSAQHDHHPTPPTAQQPSSET